MGVAKSDFCQMRPINLGLIKNTEHVARIDLDRSRFEKERNQWMHGKSIMSEYSVGHFIVPEHQSFTPNLKSNPTAELWCKTLSRIKVDLVLHQT